MKILCAYSGLEFSCEHFPGYLSSRETYHPIFNLSQKKLLSYLGKWSSGELTSTDSYLLFIALLKSSDLIHFRVPTFRTVQTDSIVAINMEALAKAVIKLNTVTNPNVIFPNYAITPETKSLGNVQYWIQNWEDSYAGYRENQAKFLSDRDDWKKLQQKELALERLIRSPHKDVSDYASQLASWAAVAGNFPDWLTISPFNPAQKISCATYWEQIIYKASKTESLYSIPTVDLEDLLTHCEDNIPAGSLFSNALFKILRTAKEKKRNFLGLGDQDLSKSTYTIIGSSDEVESANLQSLIDSAPEHEPKPEDYPTRFAYMKAKLRWDLAKKTKKDSGDRNEGETA